MFEVGDKVWFRIGYGVRIGEIKSKQNRVYRVLGIGLKYKMTYKLKEKELNIITPQAEIMATEHYMRCLATQKKVKPTENMPKIARARVMMKLGWNKCPCGGDGRGCISDKCLEEIKTKGICHCQAFKRR